MPPTFYQNEEQIAKAMNRIHRQLKTLLHLEEEDAMPIRYEAHKRS